MSKKLGNTRVTGKEQFYTPQGLADRVVSDAIEVFGSITDLVFIEPAGGTGAFVNAAISNSFKEIISYDIEPKHSMVIQGNFLEQSLNVSRAVTISNPPFGRNNSLSVKFFNHAALYSDYIVFIVPRSWRKWSVMNKLDPYFELKKDEELTINYVDDQGVSNYTSNNLRTCIQYWQRTSSPRNPYDVTDMSVVKKTDHNNADVALTIFGYSCGTLLTEFERKPNTTKMFLKLNHEKALEALQSVDYSKFSMNTAYTQALSLKEINYLINEYIFESPLMIGEVT